MKTVIYADDNKTSLMYIGLLLKRFGFRVMPADSGFEVLKLMKLIEADVVVLEVHMQHMDGVAVLRHMRENTLTSHIPVIMISADSRHESVEACRNLGCANYLFKPLKVDLLHNALQECFFTHKGISRKHLRALFHRKVIVIHRETRYELFAETLSAGGIYLRKENPFPLGDTLDLTIPLTQGDSLQLKGSIIYIKELLGDFLTLPPGMAVQFNEMTAGEALRLKNHLETIIAGDILEGQEEKIIEK